jgi:hypothetical protein
MINCCPLLKRVLLNFEGLAILIKMKLEGSCSAHVILGLIKAEACRDLFLAAGGCYLHLATNYFAKLTGRLQGVGMCKVAVTG